MISTKKLKSFYFLQFPQLPPPPPTQKQKFYLRRERDSKDKQTGPFKGPAEMHKGKTRFNELLRK
jgi:hypothetical protein